ncbi:hypothetical protein KFE25_001207 [Diacronema lutheri]|uniref:Uncharacterized protein n=2 Tax=Diacronema lutheri TaxID=2081491 RepID=A0A8J6CBL3_DIALT|nr:hypothetical protein KFE25_001207 [Diacronema lutheri]
MRRTADDGGVPTANAEAKALLPTGELPAFLLDDGRVVAALVGGVSGTFVLLALSLHFGLGAYAVQLHFSEVAAAFGAACMLGGASVARLIAICSRVSVPGGLKSSGTAICVLSVALISALTNLLLAFLPTPVIDDVVVGKPHYPMRWAQWIVLSFMLMFVIEAVDAVSIIRPLSVAATQGMCTTAGLLLPLARGPLTWALLLIFGGLGYVLVFQRMHARKRKVAHYAQLRRTLGGLTPYEAYVKRQADMGLELLRGCAWTWSIILVEYLVSVVVYAQNANDRSPDWSFIVECALDVISKLMYASSVHELVATETAETAAERLHELHERVHDLWALSSDVFVSATAHVHHGLLSGGHSAAEGRGGELNFWAIASSSVVRLVGEASAVEWLAGTNVPLAVPVDGVTELPLPIVEAARAVSAQLRGASLPVCGGLASLVSHAWRALLVNEQARRRGQSGRGVPPIALSRTSGRTPRAARERLGEPIVFICLLVNAGKDVANRGNGRAGSGTPSGAASGAASGTASGRGSGAGSGDVDVRLCEVRASLGTVPKGSERKPPAQPSPTRPSGGLPGLAHALQPLEPLELLLVVRDMTGAAGAHEAPSSAGARERVRGEGERRSSRPVPITGPAVAVASAQQPMAPTDKVHPTCASAS